MVDFKRDIQSYDTVEDHIADLKKYQMQMESKIKKISDINKFKIFDDK